MSTPPPLTLLAGDQGTACADGACGWPVAGPDAPAGTGVGWGKAGDGAAGE